MFRSTLVIAFLALVVSVIPASAGILPSAPLTTTLSPGCAGSCQEPFIQKATDMGVGALSTCSASARCGDISYVSCSGTSTCTGVDQSCPNELGHVVCDGVTTYCPADCNCTQDCPVCNDGDYRFVNTNQCCKPTEVYQIYQTCQNNQWVDSGSSCMTVPFCPLL